MSERCANYEKHHQKDKTHSNVDSTKAKDDEAEFDDSFSERFLRNIPFDRPNEEDNLHQNYMLSLGNLFVIYLF